MAWMQAKKYQELAVAYAVTSQDISSLKEQMPKDDDEVGFSVFVSESESAFSREHVRWAARRNSD